MLGLGPLCLIELDVKPIGSFSLGKLEQVELSVTSPGRQFAFPHPNVSCLISDVLF